MLNYRQHQDNARTRTLLLICLFFIAISSIVFVTNFIISKFFIFSQFNAHTLYTGVDDNKGITGFNWSSLYVVIFVLGAAIYQYLKLREGGSAIAISLGGRLIMPNTYHSMERQCINVVEELAIAANIPPPCVYLLPYDSSINAFAAGYKTRDAVIGVTRGVFEQLTRNELQAVIAHEFNHILNGDMKLNSRMASMLYGITCIGLIGEQLIHRNIEHTKAVKSKDNLTGFTSLIGIVLIILGWFGTQLAGFIKAAVCRQREYLADAGAVELTRDPLSLASALKAIAGAKRKHFFNSANDHMFNHMFFSGELNPWLSWFSTHPPINKRIKRLDPDWNESFKELNRPAVQNYHNVSFIAQQQVNQQPQKNHYTVENNAPKPSLDGVATNLIECAHDPMSAHTLVFTLLLGSQWQNQSDQLAYIASIKNVDLCQLDMCERLLPPLTFSDHFSLLEVAISAMKCRRLNDQEEVSQHIKQLIKIGCEKDITQWGYAELVKYHLKPRSHKINILTKKKFIEAWSTLLSFIAFHGHDDNEKAKQSFADTVKTITFKGVGYQESKVNDMEYVSTQLEVLDQAPIKLKDTILQSIQHCIEADGVLTKQESILLYCLSARLELPSKSV